MSTEGTLIPSPPNATKKDTTGSQPETSSDTRIPKVAAKVTNRRPKGPSRTVSSKSASNNQPTAPSASEGVSTVSGISAEQVKKVARSASGKGTIKVEEAKSGDGGKPVADQAAVDKAQRPARSRKPKNKNVSAVSVTPPPNGAVHDVPADSNTSSSITNQKRSKNKGRAKSTEKSQKSTIRIANSTNKDAMDIARGVSKEKELGTVTSLQQKIDELKTLPPAPVNVAALGRKPSLSIGLDSSSAQPLSVLGSNILPVSGTGSSFSSNTQGRLKADAPIFQPSNSPVSSNSMISPTAEHNSIRGSRQPSIVSANRLSFSNASGERPASAALVEDLRKYEIESSQHPKGHLAQQPSSQLLQQMQQRNQQRSTPALQANPTSRVATQRISIRDMPVYEEEAVDDRNELPSPGSNHPQLAPNFQFGTSRRQSNSNIANLGLDDAISALGLNSTNGLQNSPHAFNLPSSNGGGGSASGINATVLAGIAARANQRHQPEYNPVMEQQLMLQRQIEMLQEQQRVLMQQNNMLQQGLGGSNISALSQALLSQQAQQSHVSTEDNARLLQEQYIKVLTAQSLAQSQQLALHQAQALAQTQNQSNTGYHQRELSRASRSGLNDFVLPSLGATLARPASASNDTSGRNRAGPEMGPPAANLSGHRRRNSVQTHRPQNSIIGSFGGFVADMPDDAVMAHHRAHSRSATGDWRNVGPSKEAVLDLASAQAQLQMLSNFRSNQIGGGGHSKMASFSFPNMLPNLMMASTMGPATQSIVQQQQAFQMQLQQHQGPGPQRKSLFAPYLPQGSLPALLAAGKLVVGVLRVNKRNRSDAYVATDVLDADIYICGSKDRNRALEGDIVAVELLDVDEVWGSKKEKEEKKRKKEENSTFDQGINKLNARKNDKKKDDVEVEGQGMVLFDDEEVTDEQKPTYAGHVVAVVERMTGQLFSGQLGVLRPSSAATKEKQEAERRERGGEDAEVEPVRKGSDRPKIVWFKPTDKRVPLIAIPTEQAPSDFIEHSEAYSNKLFVATIKRWPITSLHPFGALVDELGSIGDLEVETSALLKDCNFPTEDFQDATLRCLPPMPWSIPEREYEIRRDMRDARVFTIDPATARDLDDALSIKHNEDGTFEVGVHIADVSHFVRPNTALDRDARKRATSVYLVQRAVPMLPPLLSEQLCSLVPGVERLTFSAFFTLDPEGNILSKTFSKSIIKSCVKLAYDEAQGVLDGGKLDKEIQPGHRAEDIEEDIKNLNSIAVNLRNRRFKDGALRIEQPKLAFVIDEFGKPTDVRPYERMASHELIEEFMLLANMAVAAVIANGLPEQALLRRHEAPIARRVDAFIERAKRLGFDFAGVGSSEMQAGFEHIENYGDKLCLQILATRAMTRAKYFCAGMLDIAKYGHFALNAPVYTHFTSPIRRYADILVHRMLEASLTTEAPEAKFVMDRDQVAKCAQHCNAKRDAAKIAQEQSAHLHLCNLIDDLTKKHGPVIRDAKIVGVLDNAFDVVVPEFRIEKRVHVDKMPLLNHVYDEHLRTLSLYWDTQDVLSYLAAENDDEYIRGVLARNQAESNDSADVQTTGIQDKKSASKRALKFENIKETDGGHRIQVIQELQTVPVMIIADVTKSPPVIQCLAISPFASGRA